MPIKRINEFPEGSGSLGDNDIFLFMDDPSGSGITKKINLGEVRSTLLNQPATLRFRQGTNSERLLITPASGEPIWTTDTQKLYIGDGVTVGGDPIASIYIDSSGVQSIVPLGTNNVAYGDYSTIVGGNNNVAKSNYAFVGGINNLAGQKARKAIISGSNTNTITVQDANASDFDNTSPNSLWINYANNTGTILGSVRRTVVSATQSGLNVVVVVNSNINTDNTWSRVTVINTAESDSGFNQTVHGISNVAYGDFSTIGGGRSNKTDGVGSTVGGGFANNNISVGFIDNYKAGDYSTIPGGTYNWAGGNYSTIGGGTYNIANSNYSVVGGGYANNGAGNAGSYSSIIGGSQNTASANYTTVGGGSTNSATANHSAVGGGYFNTSSAIGSTVGGGFYNRATSENSMIPGGRFGKTTRYGELSHAAGYFSSRGDAQHTILVARRETTTNTANQVLFLDGSSSLLTIPTSTCWTFNVKISAYNQTDNTAAWWNINGGIRRNAAGTVALIGTVVTDTGADDGMTATASVVADDTNKALEVRATGMTSKNIRWVAVIDISQVSYGTP